MRTTILLALLLATGAAGAASFDCSQAATRVEKLVCANKDLSEMDDSLAEAYELEKDRLPDGAQIRRAQRDWLVVRNACADAACLVARYEERLRQLSCDPQGRMAGAAIGAAACAGYTLRVLERELQPLEARRGPEGAATAEEAAALRGLLAAEARAWRQYRRAQCDVYGAREGGAPAWKNAYARQCEASETERRLAEVRKELGMTR